MLYHSVMVNKKICILFDADPMTGPKTGVGYYTTNLIQALSEIDPENIKLIGHYFNFLGRGKNKLPTATNISYRCSYLLPRKVVNLLRRLGVHIPFEFLVRSRGDFIIFPSYLTRISFYKTPYTTIVHDVTYLEHPEYVNTRNLNDLVRFMPQTLEHAAFITTISQTTKKALQHFYPQLQQEIVVEHIPPTLLTKSTSSTEKRVLSRLNINKKFILFLGTIEPRKNIINLLQAYETLSSIQDEYALVIAGGSGWKNDQIYTLLSQLQDKGLDIITTGYITDEEKSVLYKKTSLLVLPSYYEGYGMQLLEAADFGIPIVASNIDVFREIIGGGASFFNPNDVTDISQTIEGLLLDTRRQKKIIANQKEIVKKLSWNSLASSVLKRIIRYSNLN